MQKYLASMEGAVLSGKLCMEGAVLSGKLCAESINKEYSKKNENVIK